MVEHFRARGSLPSMMGLGDEHADEPIRIIQHVNVKLKDEMTTAGPRAEWTDALFSEKALGGDIYWEVPMADGKTLKLRTGSPFPGGVSDDFEFMIPGELACKDPTTFTCSSWKEVRELVELHNVLPERINRDTQREVAARLSQYDYDTIFLLHRAGKDTDKKWSAVMRDLLTMHVLQRKFLSKPIVFLRPFSERDIKGGVLRAACLLYYPD
jgi:hypothetical protein